jgi:hypothetical protein
MRESSSTMRIVLIVPHDHCPPIYVHREEEAQLSDKPMTNP